MESTRPLDETAGTSRRRKADSETAGTSEPSRPIPAAVRRLKSLLRVSNSFMHMLTVQERNQYLNELLTVYVPVLKRLLADVKDVALRAKLKARIDALAGTSDLREAFGRIIRDIEAHSEENYKKRRDAKPRWVERDAEIVRLRDEEGKTFGQIPRLLQKKHPKWVGPDGEPLARDAVEKAYHREKKKRPPREAEIQSS